MTKRHCDLCCYELAFQVALGHHEPMVYIDGHPCVNEFQAQEVRISLRHFKRYTHEAEGCFNNDEEDLPLEGI